MKLDQDVVAEFRRFVLEFEQPGFVAGCWSVPAEVEPGVQTLSHWSLSGVVSEWNEALYRHDIIDPESDYMLVAFRDFMERLSRNPSMLATADLETIRAVLTNISRGERFCDGYMAGMFEAGIVQAATQRLLLLVQSSIREGL